MASETTKTDPKRFWIQTSGCQMNVRDSEIVESQLIDDGFRLASTPEDADVIFMNTCSVRQKAEDKMYSALGRLKNWKEDGKVLAVGGCVAQQERDNITKRAPHVDVVIGTHQVRSFADHLNTHQETNRRVVETQWNHKTPEQRLSQPDQARQQRASVFVTIQEGCDNVCTFCIVPFTRGREASRPMQIILDEAKAHVDNGAKEVVLLGQNVNSYGLKDDGFPSFAELLYRVADIDGLERIRFTSPHPKDYGQDLLDAYAELPKLCPSAHMPLQAGSDRVLAAMNRGYTAEQYSAILDGLKKVRPEIHFTTDIIVGFPGETRDDFEQTLRMVEASRFAQIYAFVYSSRPMTPARKLEDPIPQTDKKAWLQELFELQQKIQLEDHENMVNRTTEVLWTELRDDTLKGRNPQGRVVHAAGKQRLIGEFTRVQITHVSSNALYGDILQHEQNVYAQ